MLFRQTPEIFAEGGVEFRTLAVGDSHTVVVPADYQRASLRRTRAFAFSLPVGATMQMHHFQAEPYATYGGTQFVTKPDLYVIEFGDTVEAEAVHF